MRTDQEIRTQTWDLAARFYKLMGNDAPSTLSFRESSHPQERLMWEMAREAQILLTDTDPDDAFDE